MRIEVLNRYKRRGKACAFTFKLSWDTPLTARSADREPYSDSYHWALMRWDGVDWGLADAERHSHDKYPPPREPEVDELRAALHGTNVESRALKAMGAK